MSHELEHLKRKLIVRDPLRLLSIEKTTIIEPHPLFRMIEGDIEDGK